MIGAVAGPRRLDCHQAQRVQGQTLARYRAAALPFSTWLLSTGIFPVGAEDWDDLLVEYKNEFDLSQASFAQLVSSVEFFFPRFKGSLAWSHTVLSGMAIAHTPKHTIPCGRHHAWFLGAHFCSRGFFRLGLGIALQQKLGLRPSELLGLFSEHVLFSDESGNMGALHAVFRLGARKGTKAKREQFAVLHHHEESLVFDLLRRLRDSTPAGCPLFPHELAFYRARFREVEKDLGLKVGWGPHSPRAGFATDGIAAGVPFTELQEKGRWLSASSLRTYIDVVTAVTVNTQIATSNLRPAVVRANLDFHQYFPLGCFDWEPRTKRFPQDAAQGQHKGPGRKVPHPSQAPSGGLARAQRSSSRGRRVHFARSSGDAAR